MRLTFLTLITLTLTFAGYAQHSLDKQLVLLTRVIQKNHYNTRAVNDSFSAQVFERLINELDEDHLYFTQKDLTVLAPFRNRIIDEMSGKSTEFTKQLSALYKTRLQRANEVLLKLIEKPFAFDTPGSFSASSGSPADEATFEQRLSAYYKSEVLERIVASLEADSIPVTKAAIVKAEPDIRKKVLTREGKDLTTIYENTNELQKKIEDTYLETIASNFDPHTNFFEPDEKEDFQQGLSSEAFKYGFVFEKNDEGKYVITGLSPGSAAWKSGSIHKDDEIVSIQPEEGAAVLMQDAEAATMLSALDNSSNKKIKITVRSADGVVKTVNLQKEKLRNDENIVRGFVLNGATKMGYISLPSFYTEWGNNGSSSCANDIAKEIVKLKKENISGLILDLRYNGGGSLQEAMELIGIFIDVGPACIIKDNTGKTIILKDPNRGTIYDGPLIVMINGQSASASEMVAGTLQDYHRALIVGSNSFGKATMQSVFPLDTLATNPEAESDFAKKYGYVKVTEGKLFRITGKTAQLNGVVPDVALPDAFELYKYTERSLANALPSDTVMKKVLYTPLPEYNVKSLADASRSRVSKDFYFTTLTQTIQKLKQAKLNTTIPLQWENWLAWHKQQQYQRIPKSAKEHHTFTVENSSYDQAVIKLDDYQAEVNANVKSEMAVDKYIEEAYHILTDIIKP